MNPIDALATRRPDYLDFHEVAVWTLREARQAAYLAGLAHRAVSALDGRRTNHDSTIHADSPETHRSIL